MTTRATVRPVARPICRPIAGGLGALLLGPELLSNGGFDSDTVWTKGPGWTIVAGEAICTTPGVTSSLSQPVAFIPGRTYQATIVVSSMAATSLILRGYLGAAIAFGFPPTITSAGTLTRQIVATSADTFAIDGSVAAMASINSASLRLVAT
jgi:hypothetical protein